MLTRRDFIAELAGTGAAIAAFAAEPAVWAAASPARRPVVSIHMDQPYVDLTGLALPYLPPAGVRAGAPVSELTETEIRSHYLYF